jgi:hypothetical protein
MHAYGFYNNFQPSAFMEQTRFLHKNNYNVSTLAELLITLDSKEPIPPRTIVITFYDGFMPTVFVLSDYVNSGKAFLWLRWGDESLRV